MNLIRFGQVIINTDHVAAVGRTETFVWVRDAGFEPHKFTDPGEMEAVWRYFRGRSDDGTLAAARADGEPDPSAVRIASEARTGRDAEWEAAFRTWLAGQQEPGYELPTTPAADPARAGRMLDDLTRLARDEAIRAEREWQEKARQEQAAKAKAARAG